jgi:hypothetical protein
MLLLRNGGLRDWEGFVESVFKHPRLFLFYIIWRFKVEFWCSRRIVGAYRIVISS